VALAVCDERVVGEDDVRSSEQVRPAGVAEAGPALVDVILDELIADRVLACDQRRRCEEPRERVTGHRLARSAARSAPVNEVLDAKANEVDGRSHRQRVHQAFRGKSPVLVAGRAAWNRAATVGASQARRNSATFVGEDHDCHVVGVESRQATTGTERELWVEVVTAEEKDPLGGGSIDQIRVERRTNDRSTRNAVHSERRCAVAETVSSSDENGRRHQRARARKHAVVEIRNVRMSVAVRLAAGDRTRRRGQNPENYTERHQEQELSHTHSISPFWTYAQPSPDLGYRATIHLTGRSPALKHVAGSNGDLKIKATCAARRVRSARLARRSPIRARPRESPVALFRVLRRSGRGRASRQG